MGLSADAVREGVENWVNLGIMQLNQTGHVHCTEEAGARRDGNRTPQRQRGNAGITDCVRPSDQVPRLHAMAPGGRSVALVSLFDGWALL